MLRIRMRRLAFLLALPCAVACQPEPVWTAESLPPPPAEPEACVPKSAEAGRCAERCGSYQTDFEQTEGDCGSRPAQVTRLAGDPTNAPAPCRGVFSSSPDRCTTKFDIRCPTKDASGTSLASLEQGSLQWASDASGAEGTLRLWVKNADGETRCHSEYAVTIQRR